MGETHTDSDVLTQDKAMAYTFQTKHQEGLETEEKIAHYLKRDWIVHKSSREQQSKGIDYLLTHKEAGVRRTIEIKSDAKTFYTGNCFLEIVSVDIKNISGWVYTCEADYLWYVVPQKMVAFITTPEQIREKIIYWTQTYPAQSAQNEGYKSYGILVPLKVFRSICLQVIKIPE